jgi:aminoglycoside phosphotransferase family enzyme
MDDQIEFIGRMQSPDVYPHPVEGKIQLLETHIS